MSKSCRVQWKTTSPSASWVQAEHRSPNPRFADHGDIGACDTTSLRRRRRGMMSDLPADGDPAPSPPCSTRTSSPPHPAKKEASNPLDQGPPGGAQQQPGCGDAPTAPSPSQNPAVCVGGSTTQSSAAAVAAAAGSELGSAPPPGQELGSALFQTVIISWPACPASPSCPEDACTSAFCQEVGHTNAISDSSSKGEVAAARGGGAAVLLRHPSPPLLSDGAAPPPPTTTTTTSPLIMRHDAVVNLTKTVNHQHKIICDIPTPPKAAAVPVANNQLSSEESFNQQRCSSSSGGGEPATPTAVVMPAVASTYQPSSPTGNPAQGGSASSAAPPPLVAVVAKTASLSNTKEEKKRKSDVEKAFVLPVTGWRLPPGGGLRGGGGETTAISNNGTTGWGPPPAGNNPGNSGGWGAAPPPANQGAVSAWGSPPAPNMNNNNNNSNNLINTTNNNATSAVAPPPSSSLSSSSAASNNGDEAQKQLPQQQLQQPPQQQQQQLLSNGIKASPPGMAAPSGSAQPSGSTSWAAAAGKGLPPSEPSASGQMNGATNKQLEQLNSVREALFSQDGWGGQHVKQDTSWDVGGALSEPATPVPPSKAESMQWQAPTTARNDGTDLWKSTLSGVPQAPKQQPATPWGNHTPAHPADYKTWGEPDEDPSAGGGGGGSGGGGGDMGVGGGRGLPPPPPSGPSWGGMDDQQQQQQPAWDSDRGPVKPKEDSWNANPVGGGGGGGGQWNSGRPQEGGGGWGAPPPTKPSGGGWSGGGQPGREQPWHHSESPTIGRRFDDGGWKDMPMPNMGSRGVGPPGPPSRLPPGALKPNNESSPWGQPHNAGRSWGDMEPMGGGGSTASSPWMDDKPTNIMGGGGGGGAAGWGAGEVVGGGWPAQRKPMRSSPSWEDPTGGMGGPDRGGWGSGRAGGGGMLPPGISKEGIWTSKQFRILCDMGFRKEDVEVALRNTNLQLDDALEMLNAVSRAAAGGMPGRGGNMGLGGNNMPPGNNDMMGFPGSSRGGVGMDPGGYDMRFSGGGGGGGMPYPPGGDCLPPGSNPSLQNNPSRAGGGLNPALVQQMSMGVGSGSVGGGGSLHPGGGPPRPSQSGGGGGGPPSTSQLRLLVQQIQMAVQAGHLNAQILNQPLAPQTLLLLNQLLQQIKALAQYTQQHAMAVQASAGGRGGGPSSQALLHLNVQITKHKQQITNLQNQITAQQAQYLKNQQPQPPMGGGMVPGGGGMVPDSPDLSLSLGNLSMAGDHHHHQQQQQQQGVGGSKLNKWIKSGDPSSQEPDFSRAPGSSAKSSSSQQPSPNILLDPAGPWSNGNNGAGAGGWPDSNNDKNGSNSGGSSGADAEPDFGIPEFVPGKAWKGTTIKDPSEDPTLTPGSVATTPILHQQQQSGDKISAVSSSSIATTMMENSLGLASSTWSFGTTVKESSMQVKDGWGMPQVGRETNLTPMGQDLWGLSRPLNKQPAGGPMSAGDSGWPAASPAVTTNGWSNGTNVPIGQQQQQQQQQGSAWLLLRNLTAQIDGSTLRTLCLQHGPLNNFRLYLTHGIALAKYSNGSEAKKAQSALNNCVLGNTTILAEVAGEPEVESIVRALSQAGGGGPQQGRGPPAPVQPPSNAYSAYSKATMSSSSSNNDTWGGLGGGGGGNNPWPTTGLGGSVWGAPDDQHNRTTPLNSFLPPDLLSETM